MSSSVAVEVGKSRAGQDRPAGGGRARVNHSRGTVIPPGACRGQPLSFLTEKSKEKKKESADAGTSAAVRNQTFRHTEHDVRVANIPALTRNRTRTRTRTFTSASDSAQHFEVRSFCLHVAAGAVFVLPAAVRGSGAGRSEDGGEPVEARAGPHGEADSGGPHSPAELGGGGVAGGAERPAGDGPGPDPGPAAVWRATGPRGGRRWDAVRSRRT